MSRRLLTPSAPSGFDFIRTIRSHGWFDLEPFRWDPESAVLTRPMTLTGGRAGVVRVAGTGGWVEIELTMRGAIRAVDTRSAERQVRWMLRLDEDLDSFYAVADRVARPDLRWTRDAGVGRLLRGATIFEDLVKLICTTNCTWALTRVMIRNLVERLGRPVGDGLRTFPDPDTMAGRPPRFYRDVIRAGYRGSALLDLARRVSRGDLDPDDWIDPAIPVETLRETLLSVRGAGPYVVDNMLKLLGRYDGLGLDSWCRGAFARLHTRGRRVSDRRIQRYYEPFGRWRGLALWCDLTRDWFDEKFSTDGGA